MKIIKKVLLSVIVGLTVISTPLSSLGSLYLRANSEDEGSTLQQAENHIITKATPIKDIFPDTALANLIANQLDKAVTAPVTNADLDRINAISSFSSTELVQNLEGVQHLSNLDYINLVYQNIQDLSPLGQSTKLKILSLQHGQIKDITPLRQLTNLTSLTLSYNKIEDITVLSRLTKLSAIYLADNLIQDITPITEIPGLHHLAVGGNPISDITPLNKISRLLTLDLTHSPLIDLTPISTWTSLTSLSLGSNQLQDLTLITPLTNLKTLNLPNNQLHDITGMSSLQNLTTLSIQNNQVIDITAIGTLQNLEYLYMDNNQIQDLTPIGTLKNLKQFNANDNQVADISGISALQNLRGLALQNNQVADITTLGTLKNIRYLYLDNNQIQDISALSQLDKMYELYLNNNKIRNVAPLINLSSLQWLQLSHNQIQNIEGLLHLTNLEELYLSDNQIQDISPLTYLTNIIHLELAQNQIQNVDPISGFSNLEYLNLDQQKITVKQPYEKHLQMTNKTRGAYGKLIPPDSISHKGVYTEPDIVWDLSDEDFSGPDAKTSVNYTWRERVYVGFVQPVFSGTYEIVLSEYVAFMVDGNEYQRNAGLHGERITEPEAPVKEAYDFVGWYTHDTQGHKWDFEHDMMPENPIQLYARFVPKKYNVTYNNEGQEQVVQVAYQDKLIAPLTPKKEGYTFTGWFTEDGTQWDFNKDTMPSKDVTLTARFSQNTYHVTYVNEGEEEQKVVAYGEKLTEPEAPSKFGHTFSGWYTALSGGWLWNFVEGGMPAHDLTLYARFTPNMQAVMFNYNHPDLAGNNTLIVARFGEKLDRPVDPVLADHTFLGWFQTPSGGKAWDFNQDTMPNNYLILYAQYELTYYTMTFMNGDEIMTSQRLQIGDSVVEPDIKPEKTGHDFLGWYTAPQGGRAWDFTTDKMPKQDVTLYARFVPSLYVVTYNNEGQETTRDVEYNSKLVAPREPTKAGYRFTGWFTQEVGGQAWDFVNGRMPAHDMTLYAQFEVVVTSYTVNYKSEGEIVRSEQVRIGELLTEPTPPIKVGHIFFGWYTAEISGAKWNFATDIMPSADLTLYARFIPQRFNVTFVNERGEAPAMQVIQYGKKIANPGDPVAEGYRFLGWFTDPTAGTQWDFEHDTIGTNNVTLYARWEGLS